MAAQEHDRSFNDDIYEHLCQKDDNGYWKAWRKWYCSNNLKCTNTINGKSGVNNVTREFTDFYTGVVQLNTTNADLLLETDVKQLLTDRDQYNHTVT